MIKEISLKNREILPHVIYPIFSLLPLCLRKQQKSPFVAKTKSSKRWIQKDAAEQEILEGNYHDKPRVCIK